MDNFSKWQLSEVQVQVFKGSGRRPEASGNKAHFSRIMELIGQTLLVEYLKNFIGVSLAMSFHNWSQFKCTMVGEGMQNLKNGACQGARKS